ncbi:MAG: 3-phosphoshikimate 1-carboxyvinyltransferase [Planctomycetota bacterium]|jgi:3-phosphoshikimate 1-carboxyvinyltransferase
MRRTIHRSTIDGTLRAPPSKSVMLRVVAAALVAGKERTRILDPSLCADALAGIGVAEGLGATVAVSPEEVTIEGGIRPRQRLLDCGESGLCLRMFTAVAALSDQELTLTGQGSLLRRPATSIEGALSALGARCRTENGAPPVVVQGPLRAGEAVVDGAVSSQFLSGLLLALPSLAEDSRLLVDNLASRPYVDLTLTLLERFGVRVDRDGYDRFLVPGGQRYEIGECRVDGDWSAAAFLLVLGAVGGRIRVTGLDPESAQADRKVLDILEAAGARVVRHADGAEVERGDLRAFEYDATDAPDLLPPLAALACYCEGTSVLRCVERLKHKECDRAVAVAREFSGLGVRVAVRGDVLEIQGGPLDGGRAQSHGDHRVVMALAAAGVAAGGPVSIEGAEHVAKSYPRFFEDLVAVGVEVGER